MTRVCTHETAGPREFRCFFSAPVSQNTCRTQSFSEVHQTLRLRVIICNYFAHCLDTRTFVSSKRMQTHRFLHANIFMIAALPCPYLDTELEFRNSTRCSMRVARNAAYGWQCSGGSAGTRGLSAHVVRLNPDRNLPCPHVCRSAQARPKMLQNHIV